MYTQQFVFSTFRSLSGKWESRDQLVAQLEDKVLKMKEVFDRKEEQLKNANQQLKQNNQ